jgi:HK97 family phage major capsid protein
MEFFTMASQKITALRDAQSKIIAEARERLDQISTADESRTKELETQHDAAMAEHDKIEKQIERESRQEALEKRAEEFRAERRPNSGGREATGGDQGDAPEYRDAFYAMLRAGGNVADISPELRAVLRSGVANLDGENRAGQNVGTTTAGGYTVPTTLAAFIVKSMAAWGPMYDDNLCTVINTSGGESIKIPTVNDTAVTAIAHTEGTALTDTGAKDVTFGQKSLDAFGFDTEFVRWSWELAQDSIFTMETLLGGLLGERLGRIANSQLTVGTGSSAPNGIVTAASVGKVSASPTAIVADELIDLFHSVDPAYRESPKCRWMFADTTLQTVRKLKDSYGRYIWDQGDIRGDVPATLWGKPYSINQAVDSIAANKKIALFGDFSKYFVRKVGAPVIGVMRERFWPDLGIAGLVRFDGELGDTAAVKYLKTSAT